MRSFAAAIAWEFSRRHRWGFAAVVGYLLALASIKLVFVDGLTIDLDNELKFVLFLVVPGPMTVMYLLAVFTFGFSGDLAARPSLYPSRTFTLPVTSWALAGWPMLYGATALAILWAAIRLLVPSPAGIDAPLVWPGLLAVVLLAWAQALMWMPYGLPGLRVLVTVLWLTTIDIIVLFAVEFKASEPVMIAILAPQVPIAYLAARFAVARARRGDVPDWRGPFVRMRHLADPARRRKRFDSTGQAQGWFEWRWHGRSLPALVGIVLPFELALLFASSDAPALVGFILLCVLLTPPFMATFAAATERKAHTGAGDGYGLTPFMATRPLTSVALIAAKLKMAMRSTLAAWILVLVATPLALHLSDTSSMVIDRARLVIEIIGTPRAVVLVVLALSALLASTWKQLVQSLYVGLSGRVWMIKSSAFLGLAFLTLIGPLVIWVHDHGTVQTALWDALPWIFAVLVGLKLFGAAWVSTRLYDARLLSDRTLVVGAASWLVVVVALYGLLVWFLATPYIPNYLSNYLLFLVAILATPLVRVSAAPLALAWNRHR